VVTRCVGYGYLIEKKYIGDLPESSLHAMAWVLKVFTVNITV
jgi:hypothetical protein